MPPTPTATAARPRWSAGLAALTATLLLAAGLAAVPASASDTDKSSLAPPAIAECLGVADVWHVEDLGAGKTNVQANQGITYPVTSDGTVQAPRAFAWRLETTCDIIQADEVVGQGRFDVSGWGEGFCGQSTAEPPKGTNDDTTQILSTGDEIENNRGTFEAADGSWVINVWDISWENVGRSLALDFRHDAGSNEEPGGAPGAAEVELIGGDACATNFGATTFDTIIAAELLPGTADGGDLPGVGDLIDQEPPETREESDECRREGGAAVVDSTTQGAHTSVYVHQPSTDEVWLCSRVEDGVTGDGYGGRLEVTPTDPDPNIDPGESSDPDVDGNSTACTTTSGNQAPGERPLSHGTVATVEYMLDAYVDSDEAWLCVQAGSQDARVMVPLGVSGTPGVSIDGSVATWYPDEGTPAL